MSYTELNFTKNSDIQTQLISQFPTGQYDPSDAGMYNNPDLTYKTPFSIKSDSNNNNFYAFGTASSAQNVFGTLNLANVTDFYGLIAAYHPSGGTIGSFEFIGTDASGHSLEQNVSLVEGQDVRDFYDGSFANSINGTTTQNAFQVNNTVDGGGSGNTSNGDEGTYRIDELGVHFATPFATLTSILYTASSGDNLLLLGATTQSAKAWLDGRDNWTTATDWSGGTVPTSSQSVVVNEGDPQITANVTLKASFGEGAGGMVTLAGGSLSLQGTATLDGVVNGSSKLYNHGSIAVSGLTVGGTVQLANYSTITQSGGGLMLGDTTGATASLNNAASGIYLITDDTGVTLGTSAGSSITNAGQFEKTGGTGTSLIAPHIVNTGTVTAASGTLDLAGTITGTGTLTIDDGTTLQFDANVASSQTVDYAGGSGGKLDLTSAGTFHAMVAGFSGSDTIDLANVSPQGASVTYKPNSGDTGGQLKIVSGAIKDYINLKGQYSTSNFSVSSDSNNGTLVTYVASASS